MTISLAVTEMETDETATFVGGTYGPGLGLPLSPPPPQDAARIRIAEKTKSALDNLVIDFLSMSG